MTGLILAAMLGTVLVLSAFGGPWLLRRAAPALAMTPRFSAITTSAAALIWIAAVLALGPVIAWVSRGPTWLPEDAAEVCAQCLAAATPFGEPLIHIAIPAVLPLLVPLVGLALSAAGLWREFSRLKHTRRHFLERLEYDSMQVTLHGHRVNIIDDDHCYAFSLPRRLGGIVLSRETVTPLSPAELTAVLHHENAHIRQHHHLLLALLNGVTHCFRRVPLIKAVRDAAPHYLEIAADHAAMHKSGTTALASALLKLGAPPEITDPATGVRAAVLHAAGSERVQHLIGAPRPPASIALAVSAGAYVVMLVSAVGAVHTPYLAALAAGC